MFAQFRGILNSFDKFSTTKRPLVSNPMSGDMLEYSIIPPSKYDEVIGHLRVNFPDEPLNAAVGLCVQGKPCPLLEHHDLVTMQDGLSLMAVDKETGKIAGVILNGISRKGDVEKHLEEIETVDNLQYQRIFGLLEGVNKSIDLFSKYGVDQIFELRILSVDSNYRGKGIAKELFRRSEVLARENGFKIIKTDATSFITQKVAESIGCHVEISVKYGDFKDENGKKMYDTKPPHDYYKVMTKVLSNDG